MCTVVAAVILSFSAVVTGKVTSPVTFYTTAGGIAAAFVSVFWSFGYIRLSERLRRTANEPAKVINPNPRLFTCIHIYTHVFIHIRTQTESLLIQVYCKKRKLE